MKIMFYRDFTEARLFPDKGSLGSSSLVTCQLATTAGLRCGVIYDVNDCDWQYYGLTFINKAS